MNMLMQTGKSVLFDQLEILEIHANVRYFQDCIVNGIKCEQDNLLFPKRFITNNMLIFRIDLKQKYIINWPIGTTVKIFFKIADGFSGIVYAKNGSIKLKYEEGYVPSNLDFDNNSYGDYLNFNIDQNGYILNWDEDVFYKKMHENDYIIF